MKETVGYREISSKDSIYTFCRMCKGARPTAGIQGNSLFLA